MRGARLAALVCVAILAPCNRGVPAQAGAQSAGTGDAAGGSHAPKLTFDVISVKPDNSGAVGASMGMNADGFTAKNVAVHNLLGQGFQVFKGELVGEPKWSESDRWDIEAKISAEDMKAFGKLTFDQRLRMFDQVLEQRFALKVHHETRVLPVYALVVAKSGVKMTPWKPGPNDPPMMEGSPGTLTGGKGKETGRGTTMRFLAEDLSEDLDQRIVDQTGLTGRYDFTLKWTPDDSAAAVNPANAGTEAGPSLFTALEEQLGLKLVPVKAPIDVVVIDHIEKPAEN